MADAEAEAAAEEAPPSGAELDEFGQEVGATFDEAGNRVPTEAEVAAAAAAAGGCPSKDDDALKKAAEEIPASDETNAAAAKLQAVQRGKQERAAVEAAKAEHGTEGGALAGKCAPAGAEDTAAAAGKEAQARAAGPTAEDTDDGKKKKQNINERATVVAAQHMRGTLAVNIFPRTIDALPQSACVGGTFEQAPQFWRDAEVINLRKNDDGVVTHVEFKITSGDEKGETATVEVDSRRIKTWEIQSDAAPSKWLTCELAEKKGGEARVMYSGWRSAEDAKYEKPTYKRSQWIEHSASKPNARLRSRPGYPAKLLGDDGGGGGCCTLQ